MSAKQAEIPVSDPAPGHWRAALHARGMALVPSLIEPDLVERIGTALRSARAAEEERFGREFLGSIGRIGYVSDLLAMGPPIIELLDHPRLHALLDDMFGEKVRLRVGQGICLDPGQGHHLWPRCWHADMFRQAREIADPGFIFAVNCLLFLDDVDETNGGTLILEGSHRLATLAPWDGSSPGDRATVIAAPRGSVLAIEGGTWHAAGINRSARTRHAIKLMFVRRWIRPEIDYLAIAGAQVPALPPRVREQLDVG